jgi:hypothetical protein
LSLSANERVSTAVTALRLFSGRDVTSISLRPPKCHIFANYRRKMHKIQPLKFALLCKSLFPYRLPVPIHIVLSSGTVHVNRLRGRRLTFRVSHAGYFHLECMFQIVVSRLVTVRGADRDAKLVQL